MGDVARLTVSLSYKKGDINSIVSAVKNDLKNLEKYNEFEIKPSLSYKEYKKTLSNISKITDKDLSKLNGINLSNQFGRLTGIVNSTKDTTKWALEAKNFEKTLNTLLGYSNKDLQILKKFTSKEIDGVLTQQNKLNQIMFDREKTLRESNQKTKSLKATSVDELFDRYGKEQDFIDSYNKYKNDLTKKIGVSNNSDAENMIDTYSKLLSIFQRLTNEKKNFANIDNAKDALNAVQLEKDRLSIAQKISSQSKKLNESYDNFNPKDYIPDLKGIQSDLSNYRKQYSDLMILPYDDKISKAQTSFSNYFKKTASKSYDRAIKHMTDEISNYGLDVDQAKSSKQNNQSISKITSDIIDESKLLSQAFNNIKDRYKGYEDYAVDLDSAIKSVNQLNQKAANETLDTDDIDSFLAYYQRASELSEDNLFSQDVEDNITKYLSSYEYGQDIMDDVSNMTHDQMSEFQKLKDEALKASRIIEDTSLGPESSIDNNFASSIDGVEEEIDNLHNKLSHIDGESISGLQQDAENLQNQIKNTNDEIDKLNTAQNKKVLSDVDSDKQKLDTSTQDIDHLRDVSSNLKSNIDVSSEISEMKNLSSAVGEVASAVEKKNTAFKDESKIVSGAVGSETNDLNNLEKQINDISKKKEQSDKELNQQQSDNSQTEHAKNQQKYEEKELEKQIKKNKKQTNSLQKIRDRESSLYDNPYRDAYQALGKRTEIQKQMSDYYAQQEVEMNKVADRISSIQDNIDNEVYNRNISDMQKKLSAYAGQVSEPLEKARQQVEDYQNLIKNLNADISRHKDENDTFLLSNEDLNNYDQQIQKFLKTFNNSIRQVQNTMSQTLGSGIAEASANKVEAYFEKNTRAAKKYGAELQSLAQQYRQMTTQEEKTQLDTAYRSLQSRISAEGLTGKSTWESLKGVFGRVFSYSGAYDLLQNTVMDLPRQMWSDVLEYDDAMMNLRMATSASQEQAQQLMETYSDMGNQLKSTATDVATSSIEWQKQGKTIEESNALAQDSIILSKIGDLSSEDSTATITAAMKSYDLAESDVMDFIDQISSIDMASATNVGGLAEAFNKVAANAKQAGVSTEEVLSYAAVIGETTQQDMASVGNTLNSVFSRMGNIKIARLKDYETGEDLSNVETVLRGVGIQLRDSQDEFRDFDEVLEDTASRWDTFSGVQQRAVAQAFAG